MTKALDAEAEAEASVSPLLSWEQVTVHFWPATFTVLDDNSLQRAHTAVETTRRHSIFYFAARHTRGRDHQLTTSIQPTLDACGPSRPQTGNERERERVDDTAVEWIDVQADISTASFSDAIQSLHMLHAYLEAKGVWTTADGWRVHMREEGSASMLHGGVLRLSTHSA